MVHRPYASDISAARLELERLQAQAQGLRVEVARLQQDLAEARSEFGELRATQLMEANEHLVLAALHAQACAETASGELDALARAAQRDGLTDTPNRALMLDRLEGAITLARRRASHLAVLFLDLDHFKQVNDSLGHAVGDEVLRYTARCLESVVRDSDTVSRHGGDEFLVLLAELAHAGDAGLIAGKMLAALNEPCHIGGHVLHLTVSIGIALYPDDGEDAATLIARADAAMYLVKGRGRSGVAWASSQN